jgi:protease-4
MTRSRRFDLIAFDWDGTLFDSTALIVRCIQRAAQDLHLPVPSDEEAAYVIGLGLHEALQKVVPGLPPERYPELGQRYRHHYFAAQHEISLFQGTLEMLAALGPPPLADRGHRQEPARPGRGPLQHRAQGVFDASRTADETFSKPHPRMLEELMAEFGVPPERTLMIGDTTHDLEMARNARTAAVGVSFGAHDPAAFAPLNPVRGPFHARAARLAARQCLTDHDRAGRVPPHRAVCQPGAGRAGRCLGLRRAALGPAGPRLRPALRRPGGRLPEPLRACGRRDGLAARPFPDTQSAGSSVPCMAPPSSPPTATACRPRPGQRLRACGWRKRAGRSGGGPMPMSDPPRPPPRRPCPEPVPAPAACRFSAPQPQHHVVERTVHAGSPGSVRLSAELFALTGPEAAAPATAPAAAPSPEAQRLAGLETLLQQFGSEMLRQRRSERRWRIGFRLAWFGLVLAVAWAVFTQHGVHPAAPSGPHTALIEVRGEIAEQSEASAENIVASLKSAYEDDSAKGIVMRFNSPGGSPVQAGIVSDEIQRLRKLHPNKKLYAVCEEMCASAAYYMAANADEIYVDKASIVGSIGVLMDGFGFTGLMDKLGVERRLLTAGANKGMLDPFSPVDEKQKAYAEAMLEQIHQQFITVVKRGRGDRLKLNDDTFSGLFWNGEEAVNQGWPTITATWTTWPARWSRPRTSSTTPAGKRGRTPGQALRRVDRRRRRPRHARHRSAALRGCCPGGPVAAGPRAWVHNAGPCPSGSCP